MRKGLRRTPAQVRTAWPFLYSVEPGGGLILNVPPLARKQAKKPRKTKDGEKL